MGELYNADCGCLWWCEDGDVLMTSWSGNGAFLCFLRTGGELLLKLLHFLPSGSFACGRMWNWECVGGVRGVTADLLTWDSVSLIKS